MKYVAVLMAGGKSERLWPRSRAGLPKQFLDLTGDGITMIQKTVARLAPLIADEDMYIVTNVAYAQLVREQLPSIPAQNILLEPMSRDTAPCIAFACGVLSAKYNDAIMLVLPSDHMIRQEDDFLMDLKKAGDYAEVNDALVTIGIAPTDPETGYGYIRFQKTAPDVTGAPGVFPVLRFVEKPNRAIAEEYLESGDYLWNSGMFIWRLSHIVNCFRSLMPDVYDGMETIRKAAAEGVLPEVIDSVFAAFPKISVDYGIMEKAENIFVVPSTFLWLDVGNWNALEKIYPKDDQGNVLLADTRTLGCKNDIVSGTGDRLIVLIGAEDLVVVDTRDVLLISSRNRLQEIRTVLKQLHEEGNESLL